MLNSSNSRMTLIGLTGFLAGTSIASALFEALFLTDITAVAVLLGLFAGGVLLLARGVLITNPQTGSLLAMFGGVLSMLLGVILVGTVGLVYQAPAATQPAWLQEFFAIVGGAATGGLALSIWRPRLHSVRGAGRSI